MTTETKKETRATKATNSGKLAVIKTGGRQFVVREGQTIKIEKLPLKAGKKTDKEDGKNREVKFDQVFLISDSGKVEIGTPTLKENVTGEIIEEGRDNKITVIHYRAKSRYFKKNGHRQPFMRVKVTKIG